MSDVARGGGPLGTRVLTSAATPLTPDLPSPAAQQVLRDVFHLPSFRPGQADVVAAQEAGRDVLAVAPTGSGKSLSYWVPAICGEGLTLVVSPLIALMKDQVDRLAALGVAATFVNSSVDRQAVDERLHLAASGRLRLLYLAPERFSRPGFLERLSRLPVTRFVVDEAHCISTWGHDFRPDYRRLPVAIQACGRPPIAAFTATATRSVRADIARSLSMREPAVVVTGFQRANLRLEVVACRGAGEKMEALRARLDPAGGRAIVYCGTIRHTEEVAAMLAARGLKCGAYHSGLDDSTRRRVQEAFAQSRLQVMVATSAFGMGVDFDDIRQVVHFHFPGSLESYYQEAGRAGRDGLPASCILLYSPADRDLQAFFVELAYPERSAVIAVHQALLRAGAWSSSPHELRRLLPEPLSRGAEASVEILVRAGVLGPGGRVSRVSELPVDFAALAELKRRGYERIAEVMRYATSRTCRHARITDYFGEEGAARTCDACDVCLAPPAAPRRAVEPQAVKAVLRLVARLNGRFGAAKLATLLAGGDVKWVRELPWLRELDSYGALRSWSEKRLVELVREMAESGLLAQTPGEYPVIQLSELGRAALAEGDIPEVTLAAAPAPTSRLSAPTPASEGAERLAQMLRTWRKGRAQSDGVPAYVIFHDRTLLEIAALAPRDPGALLTVAGIGEAKLQKFGDEILQVVAAAAM